MPIPGFLLVAGLLAGLLAAASKARAAESVPVSEREHLKKILATKDPRKIAAAAKAAHETGHPELAAALTKHARGAALAVPGAAYKSPFPKVPDDAWTRYVRLMRGKTAEQITPGYHLGLFAFGMRTGWPGGNPHCGTGGARTSCSPPRAQPSGTGCSAKSWPRRRGALHSTPASAGACSG
jgi:hypothetical protein